ncbi:NUDIX domain-containing protein [Aliishimia ponticola]|uniref:NUDIX domain-containing protein n=1 Tax=Aliishimia ponticola TaxID=2499833 RepID=UPI001FEA3BCE|nr:NUDIX domain-containing protein [Aliishimia ponticola]
MTLFLYGTLRHLDLLEVVLGRRPAADELTPAVLDHAAVTWVAGESYPMIRLGLPDAQATGLLLSGLSAEDRARLDFYEGGFGYDVVDVTTSAGDAQMYLPGPQVGPPGAPFDLDTWVADWGGLSVEAACEVMRHMGVRPATEVARMFPAIRKRAGSRLRAGQKPTGGTGRIEFDSRHLAYADFYALEDFTLRTETFDGDMTPPLRRAVFHGMDAALVLPYDPVRDRVLLVEQARLGPIARGDAGAWQLEPIAGHVDPGETPEEAARREAQEEARLDLQSLELVAEAYASPGGSTDFFYIYVGIADLPDGSDGVAGLESEGENIRSHLLDFDDFMARLDAQQLSVAPLVLAGYWLARHRDRLRSA